jgi:hypothetical protein
MRQLEDLVRHRNKCDHRAEHRDQLAGVKKPEIAVFAQGLDVQKHSAEPYHIFRE